MNNDDFLLCDDYNWVTWSLFYQDTRDMQRRSLLVENYGSILGYVYQSLCWYFIRSAGCVYR